MKANHFSCGTWGTVTLLSDDRQPWAAAAAQGSFSNCPYAEANTHSIARMVANVMASLNVLSSCRGSHAEQHKAMSHESKHRSTKRFILTCTSCFCSSAE